MGHVGVELGPTLCVLAGADLGQLASALVAELGPQMILAAATTTAIRQLPRRHGDKLAANAVDDLEIPYDEVGVERNAAKSLEPVGIVAHQLDSHFSDFHARLLETRWAWLSDTVRVVFQFP